MGTLPDPQVNHHIHIWPIGRYISLSVYLSDKHTSCLGGSVGLKILPPTPSFDAAIGSSLKKVRVADRRTLAMGGCFPGSYGRYGRMFYFVI